MSCANFKTMDKFNLFIRDYNEEDYFLVRDIEETLENLNSSFRFHRITVESGYYYGIQFYVEETYDLDEMDNAECRYTFDMFRSTAIRSHTSEVNKINRILNRLAEEYGFEEVICTGRFSNGEATYSPVKNNPRARLQQAVAPYRM